MGILLALIATTQYPAFADGDSNPALASQTKLSTTTPDLEKYFKNLKTLNIMIGGRVYTKKDVNDKSQTQPNHTPNNLETSEISTPSILKEQAQSSLTKSERLEKARSISQSMYCIGCKWCRAPKSCGVTRCSKCTGFVPHCQAPCTCQGMEV